MTDVEIVAGRELDALIDEKVIGLKQPEDPAPYSTDIAAAWQVVEFIKRERGWRVSLVSSVDGGEWTCAFFGTGNPLLGGSGSTSAKSAPLAICRAALAAVR